jgi:hypothetical protein
VNGAPVDPLASLHGYHLPPPVSWWPPAPGWWVLAGLVLILMVAAAWFVLARRRRHAAARRAQAELRGLQAALRRDGDAAAFSRGVSRLLRRFALTRFRRREVAGLTGSAWLTFLDETGGGWRFREGPGRVLTEVPYRPPNEEVPAEELTRLAADWIARNAEARR